jgi:hypothetical protein
LGALGSWAELAVVPNIPSGGTYCSKTPHEHPRTKEMGDMLPKRIVVAAPTPECALPALVDGAKATFHFIARVHSTGVLVDDSRTLGKGEPFELRIGKQFLLTSWEEAVQTMRVGETAVFEAPASGTPAYVQLVSSVVWRVHTSW